MTDTETNAMIRECRLARRLGRLFRIEHGGGLERRPAETVGRLIERRGLLVEELMRLEANRRSFNPWVSTELDLAMGILARAVGVLTPLTEARAERLFSELRLRRGAGIASGLRDRADGRALGHG
jgi:hypothetical protein